MSLLINYLITLSVRKEIIVLEKSLEFWIQNLYEPRYTLNSFEVSEVPLPTSRAVDKRIE